MHQRRTARQGDRHGTGGPFSITVTFSESVTGFELDDLVVGNGSASDLQRSGASYTATVTPAASGTVTVDIVACPPSSFCRRWLHAAHGPTKPVPP